MPEQLLGRIIRASSNPLDLVLDPFGGSGTTLCVAKKLGRKWLGFELSADYARYIGERLGRTSVGDSLDGPEDPIESAPPTSQGKRRAKSFDAAIENFVIDSFKTVGHGYPANIVLLDPEMAELFFRECKKQGIGGSAPIWNRLLMELDSQGKLPAATQMLTPLTNEQLDQFTPASEVAWRLLAIEYQSTLQNILSDPDLAEEFDRLAVQFCTVAFSLLDLRRTALMIRDQAETVRISAREISGQWSSLSQKICSVKLNQIASVGVSVDSQKTFAWDGSDENQPELDFPGVFMLSAGDVGIYVG